VRLGLDTNILAYAEGLNGPSMKNAAVELLGSLPRPSVVLPVQTLGELFQVLVRKFGRSRASARSTVITWSDTFAIAETSATALLAAADLAVNHQFAFWDAVILSVAAEADCRLLLSEDMQDGFVWHGVTVANPFADPRHPLLNGVLEQQR
jgi:predicted nucleic acid-binding protein